MSDATPRVLTAIDLFSGAGGLSQGLVDAGFKVVGAVENDSLAAETYEANHRGVRLWTDDIRLLDPRDVMRELGLEPGQLDLLAGCPPCQGFSTLRTRHQARSVHDERNNLVDDFVDFVEAMLPKTIMLENVPNLAKDERLDRILHRLDALGYYAGRDVAQVFNAADFGVPQRRRRMILITSSFGPIDHASPDPKRVTVHDAFAGLKTAGTSGDVLHDYPQRRSERVGQLISLVPHDGGSRRDLCDEWQLACHQRSDGFKDVYGRMAWFKPAPTITTGCFNPSRGRFLHPKEDRNITMREAACLQGFPPEYFFSIRRGISGVAKLIGNAFPPTFAERHATRAAEVILGMDSDAA